MGMDQYIYRVRKMTKAEAISLNGMSEEYISDNNEGHNYHIFTCTDDEDSALLKDMVPYMAKINLLRLRVNVPKLLKDYDIPDCAYCVGMGYEGTENSYTFSADGKTFEVKIDSKVLRDNYVIESMEPVYVADMEEVSYWRKHYELSDEMQMSTTKTIENCGYYKLNKKMTQAAIKSGMSRDLVDNLQEDERLFYHEWY